jgi:hypothetical protein
MHLFNRAGDWALVMVISVGLGLVLLSFFLFDILTFHWKDARSGVDQLRAML